MAGQHDWVIGSTHKYSKSNECIFIAFYHRLVTVLSMFARNLTHGHIYLPLLHSEKLEIAFFVVHAECFYCALIPITNQKNQKKKKTIVVYLSMVALCEIEKKTNSRVIDVLLPILCDHSRLVARPSALKGSFMLRFDSEISFNA